MLKTKDILDEKDKRLHQVSAEVAFPLTDTDKKNIDLMEEYLVNSQIEEKAKKYDLRPGASHSSANYAGTNMYFPHLVELL